MDIGASAERRVQGACVATSAAVHLALLLALREAAPTLHVIAPAPILVSLYDVGRDAAGPGPLGPELGVDPLTAPARATAPQPAPTELAATIDAAKRRLEAEPTKETNSQTPKRVETSRPPPVEHAKPPEARPRSNRDAPPSAALKEETRTSPTSAASDSASGQAIAGAQRLGPLGGEQGGTGASAPAHAARIRIAYEQQIYLWLERFKLYPQLAQRRRLEGTSTLRVRIDRRGRVLASALEKPTGQRLLDDAALEMVKRAQPFPPIPAEYPDDTFEFLAPVQFRLR